LIWKKLSSKLLLRNAFRLIVIGVMRRSGRHGYLMLNAFGIMDIRVILYVINVWETLDQVLKVRGEKI
jgi:hypothetical protein